MKQRNRREKERNRASRVEARKLADFINNWSAEEIEEDGSQGFVVVI